MKKSGSTELGALQEVKVDKMKLFYMEVPNNIENQQKAWPEFESRFPSLSGRKMYGLDYAEKNLYRVCSIVLDSDNNNDYGLDTFEFAGGTYMRLRLIFDPPVLYEKIGPAYKFLISQYENTIDWSLPFIEHYKAENILDVMVPIEEQ